MPTMLGEPVEHALHRELRLVGAEPAERSADGLLVRAAIVSTSIAGTWYGPLAWPAARSSTFMPTLA